MGKLDPAARALLSTLALDHRAGVASDEISGYGGSKQDYLDYLDGLLRALDEPRRTMAEAHQFNATPAGKFLRDRFGYRADRTPELLPLNDQIFALAGDALALRRQLRAEIDRAVEESAYVLASLDAAPQQGIRGGIYTPLGEGKSSPNLYRETNRINDLDKAIAALCKVAAELSDVLNG